MLKNKSCSVIIPIYNGAKYLKASIESVLDQDYPLIELILIDDYSTDDSLQFARHYQSNYPQLIRVITNDKNLGLVKTFLIGIENSSGEFISALGQDDVMRSNRLSRLISSIDIQNVDMICSNSLLIYDDEKTIQLVRNGKEWKSNRYIAPKEFLFTNPIIGSSVMFRKSRFKQIDKNLFKYRNYMEWIHWFQYSINGGIYFISDPLIYYRKHSDNLTNYIYEMKDFRRYRRFCQRFVLKNISPSDSLEAMSTYGFVRLKSIFQK